MLSYKAGISRERTATRTATSHLPGSRRQKRRMSGRSQATGGKGAKHMGRINIPVGVSGFEELRRQHYYYVDKSGLIEALLYASPAQVTLITRPRRFGKTLAMSMLEAFFDIRRDSRDLFAGLEISRKEDLCKKWMNQWPTIFFTFKDVDGLNFEDAYQRLSSQLSNLYKNYTYLLEGPDIDEDDKEIFRAIKAGKADKTQVGQALSTLIRLMQNYHQQQVILLLDEYDVPIAKASDKGYYQEMLDLMKGLLSTALKDNRSLRFACITGCLRIAKESIFTGTNNLVTDGIASSGLQEYFGFTQKEVDQLLEDVELTERAAEIKTWYDGYHFGDFDVYCPWDVMNYLRDLQQNPTAKPASYWKNTSDNAIIRSFIDYAGNSIVQKLEKLLEGEPVIQTVDENLTYDYLHSSEDNLWSVLYLTGYLTKAREASVTELLPEGMTALMIPNAEIKEIYETTIRKWFDDSARIWNRKPLLDAVWKGDSETLTGEMTKLLRKTISYHDYREDFYHAFLAGIFAGAGYMVESNKEHGEGRSDVVISDPSEGRIAIFEAKYAKKLEDMQNQCQKALQQIDTRMYAEEYKDDYDQILCYGISFFKKRCLVKKK